MRIYKFHEFTANIIGKLFKDGQWLRKHNKNKKKFDCINVKHNLFFCLIGLLKTFF